MLEILQSRCEPLSVEVNVLAGFHAFPIINPPSVPNARACDYFKHCSIALIPFAVRMTSQRAMLECNMPMDARKAVGDSVVMSSRLCARIFTWKDELCRGDMAMGETKPGAIYQITGNPCAQECVCALHIASWI